MCWSVYVVFESFVWSFGCVFILYFVFKRTTAYVVCSSDCISYVCSADLLLSLGSCDNNSFAFQPLAGIDRPLERSWASEWVAALFEHEKVSVTPDVKDMLWSALGSLATAPVEQRTMTGLALLLQSNALRTALQPYTLDGPYGRLLDAAEQGLELADMQCFERSEEHTSN